MRLGGKTIPRATALGGTGTEWDLERVKPFIGQDVRVSFRATGGSGRSLVGKFIGVARREGRAMHQPDVIIKTTGEMIEIGLPKILNITSTLETVHVWDNDPMGLAELGYEAYRARVGGPYWFELTDDAKEAFMAFSEAVRDAVHQGR